jgi:hypothetical protein
MAKDTRDRRLEKLRYRAANREAVRALGRANYWRHRDEILARQKEQRAVKRVARLVEKAQRQPPRPISTPKQREYARQYYLKRKALRAASQQIGI